MFRYSLSWYIFTLTLLESIIKTHLTVHDNSHGFISSSQRYFDDDLNIIHEEITTGLRSGRFNDATLKLHLKFEPAVLDFKHRPIGVPHLEKVTLFNTDTNKTIDMTSISGSTLHFHSSFFENKKIPPLGNTSFNVVFLGREEGYVESNLFIHTTEGHFKYNVKGASIYSPYRLRPIVGIKLPINATFTPFIYMHNPYTEPLQIIEIYSSGGDFQLELPTGELEGSKDIWEIPSLTTRPIIRLRLQANYMQNHTAYIRIRVNSTEDVLVVPIDVEISPLISLYSPQGFIDFGVGGSLDSHKSVPLCLVNPTKRSIKINSVSTTSEAIRPDIYNTKLQSFPKRDAVECIGNLLVNWKDAFTNNDSSGKIFINYRNGKIPVEIPYYITVLEGGLTYDSFTTRYFTGDISDGLMPRNFYLKNQYLISVRLFNYSLPDEVDRHFTIENFKSTVLKPLEESSIFTIKLKPGIIAADLNINSNITLQTNISNIVVPLLSYSGKLKVKIPFRSKDYSLDLGLMGMNVERKIHFLIINNNPIDIKIKTVKTSILLTTAVLLGCGGGDYSKVLVQVAFTNLTKCNILKANEYGVIQLTVETFEVEGQVWGDVGIETTFEFLSLPVHFKVGNGKLEIGPDRLVFDQCFPGKICSHPLRVHSTFNDPMIIEDIISLPPDIRLSTRHSGHILARASKVIGYLYLDQTLVCGTECYTGLQHDTTAQWLKTLELSEGVSDFDLNLVNIFYNRYLNLTANGLKKWQNLTLRLDTTEVRGHIFNSRVKMSWPSLLIDQSSTMLENKATFTFPLTQIGNITYRTITIKNPSSYNLIVQLVFDRDYPEFETVYEGLPTNFIPLNNSGDYKNNNHDFFFDHLEHGDGLLNFAYLLDLYVHPKSLPVLLAPNQSFSFVVGFRGGETTMNSALILLRNNLTILELIELRGQGVTPVFKFGNRRPGSVQPLLFELTEKHLKDCEREKQYKNPSSPNLTVKRSFTARNIGDVTIHINGFFINDQLCEGYGFRILNCVPFKLHPNGTKKIDIAFTPDLTLSKIVRLLILDTSLNYPVNYTLHTTIPPYYLSLCSNLIVRPNWEVYFGFFSLFLMTILFFLILLIAIMDAERIKKQTLDTLVSSMNLQAQPVLDLRLVGEQTRDEIRTNRLEDEEQHNTKDDKENLCDQIAKSDKENNSPKPEIEKYTVLIPVVGRSRKKLAKKLSNEDDTTEAQKKHNHVQSHVHHANKKKLIENKIEEKRKLNNNKLLQQKNKKYNNNNNNNNNAKNIVPVSTSYEEDNSSTTTESSSNNENDDKDSTIEQKTKNAIKHPVTAKILKTNEEFNKNNKEVSTTPPPLTTTTSTTILNLHVVKPQHKRIERKKSTIKTAVIKPNSNPINKEKEIDQKIDHKLFEPNNNNKKSSRNNTNKEKKDRSQYLGKKLHNSHKNHEKKDNAPIRLSPTYTADVSNNLTPPSSSASSTSSSSKVWGENRATFSDVVARNDHSTILGAQNEHNMQPTTVNNIVRLPMLQQTNKPTMFVEPYVQLPPNDLGPIGSRPATNDFWSENDTLSNHSFFSNGSSQHQTIEDSLRFLEDLVPSALSSTSENNWTRSTANLGGLIDHTNSLMPLEEPWSENLENGFWSTGLSSGVDNSSIQPQAQPPVSQQWSRVWAPSTVWNPWTPEISRSSTRTPPGFDTFLQRQGDETTNQTTRETYSPFGSSSTIWNQQQPRPWDYQGQ